MTLGSTALAAQLDPDDYSEVIQAYHATCRAIVQRFEGHVAQFLGDGVLVYFGYPQAHEDDALRAVRTGLALLDALDQLNGQLGVTHGIQVAVRVGIHTGLTVLEGLDESSGQNSLALGATPNLAARLKALAAPDSVVLSAATHYLVEGQIVCQALGPHTLSGWPEPLKIFRVLRAREPLMRFTVRSSLGLTPMVGRVHELAVLSENWTHTRAGQGRVVLVSGEAGIGKSRLVQAFNDQLAAAPHLHLACQGAAYYQHTAFWPLTGMLARTFHWQSEDTIAEKLLKLEQGIATCPTAGDDAIPLMAALLRLPLPKGRDPVVEASPQRQRQKTLDTLVSLLITWAFQQPVVLVVEDLHWFDPSTLEFLEFLVNQVPTAALMLIVTSRPTDPPSWVMRSHLTHLNLDRLTPGAVEEMIEHVAVGRRLSARVRQQIVASTDGVPLFVEAMTRMMVQTDDGQDAPGMRSEPSSPLEIPTTLQGLLMAHLDQAGPSKAVAQFGAVVGRTFDYKLLHAVAMYDEETLQQHLRSLVAADLIQQRGVPPQATYLFKHALIQETAYQSLLRRTRHQYHQRIGQILEERFPETAEAQPELVAQHYTDAGLNEQAIDHWQKAGRRASARSVNVEAIQHLTTGLVLVKRRSETPERMQQELKLQVALGSALMASKGWAAPEVEKAYSRARELCLQIEESPQHFRVLVGLCSFYLLRATLRTAHELAEQCLHLAQRMRSDVALITAHLMLGVTLDFMGAFSLAREHCEQGIDLYNPKQHRIHSPLQDLGVGCLSQAAQVLWLLGYPDQALARGQEALALARQLSHPFSIAHALSYTSRVYEMLQEWNIVQELAEEQMVLAREHGFAHFTAIAELEQGKVLIAQGSVEESIAQMRQGLATYHATGSELGRPFDLAWLAKAYQHAEMQEEGLRVLAEALAVVDKTEERFWEAEIHRLKGEVLRCQAIPDETQAETCFQQALEVARRQEAKALELRAATSLAKLWQRQGKREEARELLTPVYNWFTEGFDTADLKDAKTLLDELVET